MAKTSEKDRVKQWQTRVDMAEKAYQKWEDKYKPSVLEDYYYGHQWEGQPEELARQNYVINLCFPSVEVKLPSLMFYRPQVRVEPRPNWSDDPGNDLEFRTQLRQDTLNTFLDDKDVGFKVETTLAMKEAFPRFGIVEVGYSADFIDNPRAGKPMLHENGEEMKDGAGNAVITPDRTQVAEQLFVKRIPSKTFRVAVNGKNRLRRNDWCGYYEWHYPDDLKRNPRYSNTANLKTGGKISGDYTDKAADNSEEGMKERGMVKIWKIWDLRTMSRCVFVEGGEKYLLQEPFQFLPFASLKFHDLFDEFYPLPPMFNWIHPQNELNETRNAQRIHRKRFYRRYGRLPTVDEAEWRKVEDGGDGVCGVFPGNDAVWAIEDAPLDGAIARNVPETKQDFLEISGIGGEERGVSDADTATQANIIDVRSRIRENYSRSQVAEWLGEICELLLMTIDAYMELPMWIKVNVDPQGPYAQIEQLRVFAGWLQIKKEELGGMRFSCKVDVESLSPLTEDARRQSWERVLTIMMTQPQLAMSDVLLKKTLAFYDIRSDKEIQEVKKGMTAILMMQAASAAQKSMGGDGQGASPGPTPDNPAIQDQLVQQMPGGVQ